MLGRKIRKGEWLAILGLTLGIALVQASQQDVHLHHAKLAVGLFSVTCACLTSGFAGVYFEKTLLQSKSSIWMINLQMSLVGTSLAMFACLAEDTESIAKRGFFAGYTWLTWLVIFMQAVAGLSIAAVCRHADNIYKGFAYGWSVLLACMCEYVWFGEHALLAAPDVFAAGAGGILIAAGAYVWLHEWLIPRAVAQMEAAEQAEAIQLEAQAQTLKTAGAIANDDDNGSDGDVNESMEKDTLLVHRSPAGRTCSVSWCVATTVEYICETSSAELARHIALAAHHSHKERDRSQSNASGNITITSMSAVNNASASMSASGTGHAGMLTARSITHSARGQVGTLGDVESAMPGTGAGAGASASASASSSVGGKYIAGTGPATPQAHAARDRDWDSNPNHHTPLGAGPSTSAGAGGSTGSRIAELLGNVVASTPIYRSVREAMDMTRDFFNEEPEK